MAKKMLKRLQRRFIAIALVALIIIFTIQLFSVNIINVYQRDSDIRNMLYLIADNGGHFPSNDYGIDDPFEAIINPFGRIQRNSETPYSTRYFVVKLNGNIITDITTENIAAISDQRAFEYASQIFEKAPGYGFVDNYRYYYAKDHSSARSIMVFIDFQRELEQTFMLASISFLVGAAGILLMIYPIYLLSKRALRPVKNSIEKQKQFVTDAGHELKTPLAIICADVDVLEFCDSTPESKEWLQSIRQQTTRMNVLVKNLVELSKLNEVYDENERSSFNLSEAVLDTAANFEPLAKARGIEFELFASPNIYYNGNEAQLRQLVSILCDNAVKYASEEGKVRLSLNKNAKNIFLDVYNDCEHIDKAQLPLLFERFYRADNSRSRETGGYGIGLSIARAVVERHRGKISAVSSDSKSITFKVVL